MASPSRRPARAHPCALGLAVFASLVCIVMPASPLAAQDDATSRDLRLGKGLYDQGLFERAIPPLERVREGDATAVERAEALFHLGEAYRGLDRLTDAEARFAALLRAPSAERWAPLARLGRGECLVRLDRAREAAPLLDRLLDADADALEEAERTAARYWLAEARAQLGDATAAISGWRSVIDDDPDHPLAPFAAYHAGLALRDDGRPADGLALLDRLPDAVTKDAALADRLRLLAGELALAAGDTRRALGEYRKVRGEESEAAALAGVAWAASALGDTDALEDARRRLVRSHPNSAERADVDLLAGSACAREGDVAATDAALSGHSDGARADEARFWMGWARRESGRPEEAAESFLSVTGTGEWAARAVLRAEEALRRAERWEDALAAARRFIAAWGEDPRLPTVVAGAVESSFRLGAFDRVLELDRRFQERWPDDALATAVRHFAAESALAAEDHAGAVERFEALWRDPAMRTAIGPRYAWALRSRDGAAAAPRLAEIADALEGAAASEVGLLLGRARLDAGDRSGALVAFRAAAAADLDGAAGARARLEVAILHDADGSGEAAEAAYRAVLASEASGTVRARARIDLASLLSTRGDDSAAVAQYELYLSDHSGGADRADAWIGLAFGRFRLGDHDGAVEALDALREEGEPSDVAGAEALFLEGRIHRARGNHAAAIRALTACAETHPDSPRAPEALLEIARAAEEVGDTDAQRSALDTRLTRHPDADGTDEALYRLGWLEFTGEHASDAAERFRTLVRDHPESEFAGDAHFRLGEIAYASGEWSAARDEYRRAIASPDAERVAERALYRIGWTHRRAEEWGPARSAFEQLAREYPEGDLAGEALYLAADSASRADDDSSTRELLERFVAEHPDHERGPPARIRLAEALTEEESWSRVHDLLEPLRTVKLEEPWRTRHRLALGRALVRIGKPRAALPVLTEALDEGAARAAEAQFEIGLAHRAAGNRERAVDAFIEGPVLYPFQPWAVRSHLEAGRELLAAGKRREAERVLGLAVELDPDGPHGREARRLLGRTSSGKEEF